MLTRAARLAIVTLVRLFYPRIEVRGRHLLPSHGALLFVANHPNGLLDPLVIIAGLGRHISFLAKSTFFSNPVGRLLMEAFGALPVYRQRDQDTQGDRASRNEATFARCRALLRSGRPLALFPEGTTHSQASLLPLRSGAARIALGTAAESGWAPDVKVVPLGLWYQNKSRFRSSALVVVGAPLSLTDLAELYSSDLHAAVDRLTDVIDQRLDAVVLQAENAELLRAMPTLAVWTAASEPQTLEAQHARTAELLAAYGRLRQTHPERLAAIERQARRYAEVLRTLGIHDPWELELNAAQRGRMVWLGLLLVAGFVPALAGFALSYGPYRLAAPLTPRLLGEYEETLSTGKLIIGSVLVMLGWLIAAIICGALFGGWWGLALLALAPPLAYIALRWGEIWHEFREALAYTWLGLRQGNMVRRLVARRRALADQVAEALQLADITPS